MQTCKFPARRKFLLCQTNNVDVSMDSLLFTPVLAVRNNILVLMLYRLVCIVALLLGQNCNKVQ